MSGGDRAKFLDIWQQHVTRPGSEKLLDWLDKKTDFFTAPASTRFHGACEGGLCMHSLNVYHALHDSFFTEGESEESYAICAQLVVVGLAQIVQQCTDGKALLVVALSKKGVVQRMVDVEAVHAQPALAGPVEAGGSRCGEEIRLLVQPFQQLLAAGAGDVLVPEGQKLFAVAHLTAPDRPGCP